MWRWIWTVEQSDNYHQRSGQVVLQSTERLYAMQWQFSTRGQGRLVYSLMACGKYEILSTDVLDCRTWNLMEWSQVLCVCSRWYVSQVIYNTIHHDQDGVVTSHL
jgi:hypothetical protein